MVELLCSPWTDRFEELLNLTTTSLVLCSPYIGRGPCDRIRRHATAPKDRPFEVAFLTDLSRDNMLAGGTDVAALADFVKAVPSTTVRFLPSLHAKVYVADDKQAIVTSGNLTVSGLERNFEYGALFTDHDVVSRIREDVLKYAALGSPIDSVQLETFATIVAELREMREVADRDVRSRVRREFNCRLREVDDSILSVRAGGRTAHAIFADAILHLLRQGPMRTVEMHKSIQQIHPDLCDDSIDRIIDGQHFGKKWKHGVRTAQVFLRRRGDIRLENDSWILVRNK